MQKKNIVTNDLQPGTRCKRAPAGAVKFNSPIYFATDNIIRMTLMGTTGPNPGFLGIGTQAPNQLLTVDGGNINANTIGKGYMINNTYVLWHNGLTSNIYVGVGAGNAGSFGTGNTFVGSNAGNSNTSGGVTKIFYI